jgi:hypothetical protein
LFAKVAAGCGLPKVGRLLTSSAISARNQGSLRAKKKEAKRLLDFIVEHAPAECRESMLANVRLHREIAAAARKQGLPLAAAASHGGDNRPAGLADA